MVLQLYNILLKINANPTRLNLTCANRVFIVELQWNPSVENQAISRAIRYGQSKMVQVMRYRVVGTVEEVSLPDLFLYRLC